MNAFSSHDPSGMEGTTKNRAEGNTGKKRGKDRTKEHEKRNLCISVANEMSPEKASIRRGDERRWWAKGEGLGGWGGVGGGGGGWVDSGHVLGDE